MLRTGLVTVTGQRVRQTLCGHAEHELAARGQARSKPDLHSNPNKKARLGRRAFFALSFDYWQVPVPAELLLVDGLLVTVPVEVPVALPLQFCDFMAGAVVLLVEFDPTAPFAPLTEPVVLVSGDMAPPFVPVPVAFEPLLIPPAVPLDVPEPVLCAIADVAIPIVSAATAINFIIGFSFLICLAILEPARVRVVPMTSRGRDR